eukprot:282290-Rhodomonas_salina.1
MVDVQAKVVVATTTHFSEWGVFGSVILGTAVSVKGQAAMATSIEFVGGTMLSVTTAVDAVVTLSAVSSVTAALPEGHSSLAVSAGAGFKFEVSGTSAVSAKLTTPPLTVVAQGLITSSGQVGCF